VNLNTLKHIDLLVYDFDGVMTDNTAIVDQFGNESVRVNRSDGLAISEIRKKGIKQVIISTEHNPVVQMRAKKLQIPCINAVDDKRTVLENYLVEHKIDSERVVFIGNDINDLEAMKLVGMPIAPVDAHDSVKQIAKVVTKAKGGSGVIREILDLLF